MTFDYPREVRVRFDSVCRRLGKDPSSVSTLLLQGWLDRVSIMSTQAVARQIRHLERTLIMPRIKASPVGAAPAAAPAAGGLDLLSGLGGGDLLGGLSSMSVDLDGGDDSPLPVTEEDVLREAALLGGAGNQNSASLERLEAQFGKFVAECLAALSNVNAKLDKIAEGSAVTASKCEEMRGELQSVKAVVITRLTAGPEKDLQDGAGVLDPKVKKVLEVLHAQLKAKFPAGGSAPVSFLSQVVAQQAGVSVQQGENDLVRSRMFTIADGNVVIKP